MTEMLLVMKWPLIACLLLPGMLVYLGLHIVRREVIFVDLALAQVAALGTSLCIMLGHEGREWHTYFWSLGFTLVGALRLRKPRFQPPGNCVTSSTVASVARAAVSAVLRLRYGSTMMTRACCAFIFVMTSARCAGVGGMPGFGSRNKSIFSPNRFAKYIHEL